MAVDYQVKRNYLKRQNCKKCQSRRVARLQVIEAALADYHLALKVIGVNRSSLLFARLSSGNISSASTTGDVPMHSLAKMRIVLTFALLTIGSVRADEPAKAQFQALKLETLSKDGGKYEWSKAEFLAALKGGEGWEVLLTSENAALFRKTTGGPKWEYKSVKTKNSPFSTLGMKDVDAFGLILDRMAADGYTPCAVNGLGDYTLYKRVKDAKPAKTEFQTLLWQDAIKSKSAPTERFKEKEFVETLNKQGAEGWEACACNINAIIFQKTTAKWEYKAVTVTKSPLTLNIGMDKDDEAATFTLILEGLEDKGWKPCACGSSGQELLVKREFKKDKKD